MANSWDFLPPELPALPNSWVWKPLQDLLEEHRSITYGVVQPGAHVPSGVPLLRVNNLNEGRIVTDGIRRIAPEIEQQYTRTRLRGGEVLLSLVGSLGETAVAPEEIAGWNIARAIALIPVHPEYDPRWVALCLRSPLAQHYISTWANTTVQATLNLSDVGRLPIPLPPRRERRKILAILGTLGDKIELNRRMNATLEAIARAIFKSWFVDFDPVRAKARGEQPYGMDAETAALFSESFEDSELGPIPAGWGVEPLSYHVKGEKGLSYKGSGLSDAGMPMHNLNSVYEGGGYKHEGIKFYTGEYRERHLIKPGDVIVTNTEQGFDLLLIGYAAIVPKHYGEKGLFSHHLYRVRPKPHSPLTPDFIYHLFVSPRFHRAIAGYSNGTTVNMLPADALEKPLYVIPPADVVQAFDRVVQPMRAKKEANYEEQLTLTALRDALLPKLISGDIRLKEALDAATAGS